MRASSLSRKSSIATALFSAVALMMISGPARAAVMTWDPATSGGTAVGGGGTWNTSNTSWWNTSTDLAWSDSTNANDTALFSGTAGTVTLGTNINAGGLTFSSSYTLYGTTAATTLTLSGGTVNIGSNTINIGKMTLGGSNGFTMQGTGSLIFGQYGGNTVNWNFGAGAVINVSGGTLVGGTYANDSWTNDQASLTVGGGALFQGDEANVLVAALNGAGTVQTGFNGSGYNTFTVGVNNGSGTFSGVIANEQSTGNLTKTGSGIQVLSGANTYTGVTAINGGTLQISGTGVLGGGNYSAAISNSGTLVISTSSNQTFGGAISGGGALLQNGSNITTLTGANSYTGPTTIGGGALQIGNGGTTGALSNSTAISNSGSLIFNRSDNYGGAFSNAIGGPGSLRARGRRAHAQRLEYLRRRHDDQRRRCCSSAAPVPFRGQELSRLPAGSWSPRRYYGTSTPVMGWFNNGLIAPNPSGAMALANSTNDTETLALTGTLSGLSLGAIGSATYGGSLTTSATTYYLGGGGGTLTFTPTLSGANSLVIGNGGLTGTVVLTASNTYTGTTTLSGGTVNLARRKPRARPGPWANRRPANPGSIILSGGYLQYSAANQNDYSGRFSTAANQQYNVDTNGQNVTWAAALTSTGGSLTKVGLGTLTLTGSNTYTGTTTLSGGTVNLGVGGDRGHLRAAGQVGRH